MIRRLVKPLKEKSFFLFGPRGSGKSTWLQSEFHPNDVLYLDFLDPELQEELYLDPKRFEQRINASEARHRTVVIDEVQKFPSVLDIVHSQIQKTNRQFVLTGSSARKLKQQGADLLAGRALVYSLYPFSTFEMGSSFEIKTALERGGLPDAWLAPSTEHVREYLAAYVHMYLEKEIQQEQWVRKIEPFRRFLNVAAQMNGKIMNVSAISRDVGVDDTTIANYFEILEDTLLGFMLPAFHKSVRKAQRQTPKFYFVDTGIKRALERTLRVPLEPQTSAFGEAFEHWVILEFRKLAEYARKDWSFSFVRTKDDVEIDLIIERPGEPSLQVEIKSKSKVRENDAKSLQTLGKDLDPEAERWILSQDPLKQRFGDTLAIHWQEGLKTLFPEYAQQSPHSP